MNSVLFAIKHFRMRAAMRIAAMAVLVYLTAAGGVAHVWAAPNIPPVPGCKWKDDFRGGYHRLHAWCPGSQVMVSVQCSKGGKHTSSYPRPGYNKAECRLNRDGKIVGGVIAGPPTPKLPPNKPHRPE
jgi:hypothetical protein